jgi:GNAT superfamily N-acetyltransferase
MRSECTEGLDLLQIIAGHAHRDTTLRSRTPQRPNDIWAWAKEIDGYPDKEWSYAIYNSRVIALYGVIPQFFYEHLPSYEDVIRTLRRQHHLAARGIPEAFLDSVTLGLDWFDSGFYAEHGRLSTPRENDAFRGRHSVRALGLDDTGTAIAFANSWGPQWGDNGRGLLTRDYFQAHVSEAFLSRCNIVGPSASAVARTWELAKRTKRRPDADLLSWRTQSPMTMISHLHDNRIHTIATFSSYSHSTKSLVDVIELRNPVHRIGRCHLFHSSPDTPHKSTIDELFVLPNFRRRGYGSLLEEIAAKRAIGYGSRELEARVHRADDQPRMRELVNHFANQLGYVWQGEQQNPVWRYRYASRPVSD